MDCGIVSIPILLVIRRVLDTGDLLVFVPAMGKSLLLTLAYREHQRVPAFRVDQVWEIAQFSLVKGRLFAFFVNATLIHDPSEAALESSSSEEVHVVEEETLGHNSLEIAVPPVPATIRNRRDAAQQLASVFLADSILLQKTITDAQILEVLQLWTFDRNANRSNVRPQHLSWIWSDTFGLIRDRRNVVRLTKATRAFPQVIEILACWLVGRVPAHCAEFCFTSITVNKNYAARLHSDENNVGASVISAFGSFGGGELVLHHDRDNARGFLSFDVRHNILMFDGKCPHQVSHFTGNRFSVVFFTAASFLTAEVGDVNYLRSLNFPLPRCNYPAVRLIKPFEEGDVPAGALPGFRLWNKDLLVHGRFAMNDAELDGWLRVLIAQLDIARVWSLASSAQISTWMLRRSGLLLVVEVGQCWLLPVCWESHWLLICLRITNDGLHFHVVDPVLTLVMRDAIEQFLVWMSLMWHIPIADVFFARPSKVPGVAACGLMLCVAVERLSRSSEVEITLPEVLCMGERYLAWRCAADVDFSSYTFFGCGVKQAPEGEWFSLKLGV